MTDTRVMDRSERDAIDAAKYRFLRSPESAPLAVTLRKRVLREEDLEAVSCAMTKTRDA